MFYSRAVEYAIRALICLAQQERENRGLYIDVSVIAELSDTPKQFLAKILQQLGKRGHVESMKGARGGWRLYRPASQITLADLILELDGEPLPTTYISEKLIETINRYLVQTTIADLAKAQKRRAA